MQQHDQQPTEAPQPAKEKLAEVLRCPDCDAFLLAFEATSTLKIRVVCHACSGRQRRAAYHNFVISYIKQKD